MFTDPGGAEPLADYAATIDWGDNSQSAGTISVDENGVFTVQASHTYDQAGDYTITVTIMHDNASVATVISTGQVAPNPSHPSPPRLPGLGISLLTGPATSNNSAASGLTSPPLLANPPQGAALLLLDAAGEDGKGLRDLDWSLIQPQLTQAKVRSLWDSVFEELANDTAFDGALLVSLSSETDR
jgi:hypothetical protein